MNASHPATIVIGDIVAVGHCLMCGWQLVTQKKHRPNWTDEDWRGSLVTAHSLAAQERLSHLQEI